MSYLRDTRPLFGVRMLALTLLVGALVGVLPLSVARAASLTVTRTTDSFDGTCDGDCSLRDAIAAANRQPGADTITLPAGTYTITRVGPHEDANTTGDFDIADDLTITGALSSTTIIDGGNAGRPSDQMDRVFHVSANARLALANLTVQRGDTTQENGAGILNSLGSTLTLRDVTVRDSEAGYFAGYAGGTGGGLYNAGTALIERSRLSGNNGASGGGIFNSGALTINGSLLTQNTATYGHGGGVASSGTLTISDSAIRNGSASYVVYHGVGCGGGLYLNGQATLTRVTIADNRAECGGGLQINDESVVTLTDSSVSGNSVSTANRTGDVGAGFGGGVVNYGTLTALNSTIRANSTETTRAGASAGGLLNAGTASLAQTLVSGNTAAEGGGVANRAKLTLTGSTLRANRAFALGGGLLQTGGATEITDSTLDSNTAVADGRGGTGGALVNNGGTLALARSTVSNNSAFVSGGLVNNATLTLVNSTISGNSSAYSGASALENSGDATITSSTIANNGSSLLNKGIFAAQKERLTLRGTVVAATECEGPLTSAGFNLDSGASCGLTQPSDLSNTNPQLGALANNGGATQTLLPQPGSPAVNAGGTACPATDQRGVARPQGAACDIGAVEITNPPPVAISLSPATLPDAVEGQPYSQRLSASGGTAPYTFVASFGNGLPCGVTLSSDGLISGTPRLGGACGGPNGDITFSFRVTATDARGSSGQRDYRIVVKHAPTSGAFPGGALRDTFNRANGALGANWSGDVGGVQIINNQADVLGGGVLYWRKEQFGTSQTAFVTVSKYDPNASQIDVTLKTQGGSSPDWRQGQIAILHDARAKVVRVETYRPGNQGWTVYANTALTLADGDQLGGWVDASGVVRVYRNGQIIATTTLNAADQSFFNGKGGSIGLWLIDAGNAVLDDFGGGSAP